MILMMLEGFFWVKFAKKQKNVNVKNRYISITWYIKYNIKFFIIFSFPVDCVQNEKNLKYFVQEVLSKCSWNSVFFILYVKHVYEQLYIFLVNLRVPRCLHGWRSIFLKIPIFIQTLILVENYQLYSVCTISINCW